MRQQQRETTHDSSLTTNPKLAARAELPQTRRHSHCTTTVDASRSSTEHGTKTCQSMRKYSTKICQNALDKEASPTRNNTKQHGEAEGTEAPEDNATDKTWPIGTRERSGTCVRNVMCGTTTNDQTEQGTHTGSAPLKWIDQEGYGEIRAGTRRHRTGHHARQGGNRAHATATRKETRRGDTRSNTDIRWVMRQPCLVQYQNVRQSRERQNACHRWPPKPSLTGRGEALQSWPATSCL